MQAGFEQDPCLVAGVFVAGENDDLLRHRLVKPGLRKPSGTSYDRQQDCFCIRDPRRNQV